MQDRPLVHVSHPPTFVTPDNGDWHLRKAHELARAHEVDPAHGLLEHQIAQRLQTFGVNELPASAGPGLAV